jgi:hypothetical protein
MALEFLQRKAVEVQWDTSKVKGTYASIRASEGDDDDKDEVRVTDNDGYAVVTFPNDFTGKSHITVHGSRSGKESGTYDVL